MRNRKPISLLIIISFFIFASCNQQIQRLHPSHLKFKSIRFSPPQPQRVVLENGITLYLLEDHELPLINIFSVIKTGSYYEPADKIGLAALTGKVMRTGGTKKRSGEEIDQELEFMAASLGISIGSELGSASLSVLKKDLEQGLNIFADILMNPVFAPEKLDLARKQTLEAIRRENDDPSQIARREFYKLVYGDHPYGYSPTVETINKITREDLISFHRKFFHPHNIIMGISGDFSSQEIISRIKTIFKTWEQKKIKFEQLAQVKQDPSPGVNYIFKDINQTVIKLGHLGIRRDNPDYFPLLFLDYILGRGGFQSRLMKDIRTKRGLAYNVYSLFSPNYNDLGVFIASCETKAGSTVEVINLIKKHIEKIKQEKVSDSELQVAKDYLINSFVFKFTSPGKIVRQKVLIEYLGLPSDYLETYKDKINQVNKDEILKAARKYLHPDQLIILAVGNKKEFGIPLESLGAVREINLGPN